MRIVLLLLPLLLLNACSVESNKADLEQYVREIQAKPRGRIEPMPTFKPYEFFSYGAAAMRSPFEQPVVEDTSVKLELVSNVQPDLERRKEYLEQFALGSLQMMGTIKLGGGILYALVKDGEGSVVRVKEGQYMGQNHGRIVSINEQRISIIEIAPNGVGGWIERPRTLALDGLVGE